MKTLLIILWLLCGIIAVWRTYWGDIKECYLKFNCDLRKDIEFNYYLKVLLLVSPIFIITGLLSLICLELIHKNYNCWYYKIPK